MSEVQTALQENQDLQLIGPDQFKEKYAVKIGIAAIRDLFKSDGFPSVKIGERYYTTDQAAREYLKSLKV